MSATATLTTSADADAFMRKYLSRPSDAVARLVFADWLEETCVPHNAAWAYYIRLKAEADRYEFGSRERCELDIQAEGYAPKIRAKLAIPARLFVGYPKSLLQLLPAPNITVRLTDFEIPQDTLYFLPESVARENRLFPLDVQGRTFLIAAVKPRDDDLAQTLTFILNRDIVLVGAESSDIGRAIDRDYGRTETLGESVVEVVEDVFASTGLPVELTPTDPSVVRLVNLIIQEAIALRADRILITPELDGASVRYRLDGEWIERDRMALRLLRGATGRIAIMARIPIEWTFSNPPSLTPMTGMFPLLTDGLRLRIRITIQPSPDGPTTQIDLTREPAG